MNALPLSPYQVKQIFFIELQQSTVELGLISTIHEITQIFLTQYPHDQEWKKTMHETLFSLLHNYYLIRDVSRERMRAHIDNIRYQIEQPQGREHTIESTSPSPIENLSPLQLSPFLSLLSPNLNTDDFSDEQSQS